MESSEGIEDNIKGKEKQISNLNRFGAFLGLSYTLISSLFLTFSLVIVKKMTYVSIGQLTLVRNAGNFAFSIPIALYTGNNIFGPKIHRRHLFATCFLGATAMYFNHLTFRLLPLAEATIITCSNPAVIMIGARLFLKESCGLVASFTVILTVAGVLLSVRLPELLKNRDRNEYFTPEYMLGIASSIASVLCRSGLYLLTRNLKMVHFSIFCIYMGFIAVVQNVCLIPVLSSYDLPHCGWDSMLMMCMSLSGFVGYCFLTLAIQSEAVGIVSVVKSSLDIVIGLAFQVLFFAEIPDGYSLSGALIVTIAVTVIGLRKWVKQLPDESKSKGKLKFLLM